MVEEAQNAGPIILTATIILSIILSPIYTYFKSKNSIDPIQKALDNIAKNKT